MKTLAELKATGQAYAAGSAGKGPDDPGHNIHLLQASQDAWPSVCGLPVGSPIDSMGTDSVTCATCVSWLEEQ